MPIPRYIKSYARKVAHDPSGHPERHEKSVGWVERSATHQDFSGQSLFIGAIGARPLCMSETTSQREVVNGIAGKKR
jgi:hypothetical protein